MAGEESSISLLTRFDDLCRNAEVLTKASEEEFLRFVVNAGINRRKWEQAELECQRLGIELTRASQDIKTMEQRLDQARTLLDTEMSQRKRAELERDRLHQQLQLLRQIILDENVLDEMTMDKIRNIDLPLGGSPYSTVKRRDILATSPHVGILKNVDMTKSICDVEDLSFDDTHDLCESRSRLFDRSSAEKRRSLAKRPRSGSRPNKENEASNGNIAIENIAGPRNGPSLADRKKMRRSRSVVAFDVPEDSTASTDENVELVRSQRAYSLTDRSEATGPRRDSLRSMKTPAGRLSVNPAGSPLLAGEQLHNFAQKTVLKSEKCFVCQKRLKFGKHSLKCFECRITIHSECSDKVPPLCYRSLLPEVCVTPRVDGGDLGRSPSSKKAYFASPMLK